MVFVMVYLFYILYIGVMEENVDKKTLEVMEEEYLNDLGSSIVRTVETRSFFDSWVFILLLLMIAMLAGFLLGIGLGLVV